MQSRLKRLPTIMVAPNGGRHTKEHHPELPMTIAETVETAVSCFAKGAGSIHAHLRDADGLHLLDAGAYSELIAEVACRAPAMPVQITTESAGRYGPTSQRDLLKKVRPEGVSISLAEMLADGDRAASRRSYHELAEAGVAVQHILYNSDQLTQLAVEQAAGVLPSGPLQLLFVLGRYTREQRSDPSMLTPYLTALASLKLHAEWAVCAFGPAETACLADAHARGGSVRVGFENNIFMADGSVATDNAARVAEIFALL